MKTYILLLIFCLSSNYLYAQNNSAGFNVEPKQLFRSMFSVGGALVLKESNSEFKTSLGVSAELNIHINKGYYIGFGIMNHAVPTNKSTSATNLYIYGKKGFFLSDNIAVYAGIGGTIGVITKSDCCSGGGYFSLSADYFLNRYFGFGIENKVLIQNTGTFILPGITINFIL
ncbi:MAG TPA: hypothetical protein PK605_09970 [Ignavibacteria bacterium]|nr:hypothetical protein [Ignavibacteria bacterium]HRF67499.1 hypothetical protein [Ignavibacteria bacterium]HRJ04714.1 hypothetical protein [Ignavibacteria bacterium]